MHIYFSGIGGAGIGPLAEIAFAAGYEVSGSDKQDSQYIGYLKTHGITDIHIGQSAEAIAEVHATSNIDWFVYSSAVSIENPNAPELVFCQQQGIKSTKRDELLNQIISDKNLKLIAIAGTHGKTTTTAMVVWLFTQLGIPISYALPAKTSFAAMGQFTPGSEYFVYECDEFDRNFLAFKPHTSLITGVTWDHHEIFKTREDYQNAFREFIEQSDETLIWLEDAEYLSLADSTDILKLSADAPEIENVGLKGRFNRMDGWLAIQAVHSLTSRPIDELVRLMRQFPGLQRRMEPIVDNLYSDYAHTPEKVKGAMSAALEMAAEHGQQLIVVYEPLTNRRQHFMANEYKDCFAGASKVYWLPSYLAREDTNQTILSPEELISHLADPSIAVPGALDDSLAETINKHLSQGDMVVGMAGGGGNSLDDYLRLNFKNIVKP